MRHPYLNSPAVAHVLPLAVFMLLNTLPSMVAVDNSMLPWWRHSPEHWIYPLQTVTVGALLCFFWKHYTFKPIRGVGLAILLGAVGIALWLLPAEIYIRLTKQGVTVPEWCSWLGLAERSDGFDPYVFESTWAQIHTLIWRFIRMVVVVSFIEEIFWRGFLMRYIQADGRPFLKIPFGKHDWRAYAIVTGCVVLIHNTEDWLGALCFGSLMYYLAVRTKSLGACVIMHAVANLLLGIYVLLTRNWGFW